MRKAFFIGKKFTYRIESYQMGTFENKAYGRFHLPYSSEPIDIPLLVQELFKIHIIENKGRGGIRIVNVNNKQLICRQYIHGGLFRIITRDLFFTGKRGIHEVEILSYLKERGFPVVAPFCLLTENRNVFKRLYLFTFYEKNTVEFLEYLRSSGKKKRMRMIKRFAQLLWSLETLGIYHPDLHLNNILVAEEKDMIFLDFDKARKKTVTKKDMEGMFWRLNRFVEKMEEKGYIKFDIKEKILFLRTYKKISGYDIITVMEKQIATKRQTYKIGWFIESFLYGGVK